MSFSGYDYDASTGTYMRRPRTHHAHGAPPPPRPPKETPIKETQAVELEGSSTSRGSLDSLNPRPPLAAPAAPPPKHKARILSLDGGGIRGYSTLVILQELMHQIYVASHSGRPPANPSDLPRPCEYFDLIGGNGTGGLIALMLGRMRMDVESAKEYYVRLTRFVFITDKTLLGMPYGKTLFKASRLEEAIRHCVRENTASEPRTAMVRPESRRSNSWHRRTSLNSEHSFKRHARSGNSDALLLDPREGNACKTFVTTMLEGSVRGASPVLLRSYPSPAESNPSYGTTIWEAGRATCATAAAFKPVTIGQTKFLDEGIGQYNPAFQVLEEAHQHEFPNSDIDVFVSIGTGKRQGSNNPHEKHEWWEGVAFESFAEAKRRLIRRIDDCERVHRELVEGEDGGRPRLAKGGVTRENYYRFNVEVGVGEFGMNEWNRLAEVSTGTRRYLTMRETSKFVRECAAKLVNIDRRNRSPSAAATATNGAAPRSRAPPHPPSSSSTSTSSTSSTSSSEPVRPRNPIITNLPATTVTKTTAAAAATATAAAATAATTRVPMPDEKEYTSPITQHPPHSTSPPRDDYSFPEHRHHYDSHPVAAAAAPPPKPPKTPVYTKSSRVLVSGIQQGYDLPPDAPNPEIRVTSPTTVAGGDSDEERERRGGEARARSRRRRRSRSRSGSSVGLRGILE